MCEGLNSYSRRTSDYDKLIFFKWGVIYFLRQALRCQMLVVFLSVLEFVGALRMRFWFVWVLVGMKFFVLMVWLAFVLLRVLMTMILKALQQLFSVFLWMV